MEKAIIRVAALVLAGTALMARAQVPGKPVPSKQGKKDSAPATAPNPNSQYRLGPDSLPQEGVPKGEIRGPFTLPCTVYPGTQHTYWVYVPAQYDPSIPAALMVFQDGQAFKDEKGDVRAQNVMDNLIYRREIPVMIGVFINPGRRPDQPEPTPRNWGDRDTNRPTEYNSLDDKYARVITEELMPALAKDFNISKDPSMHGIGGSSSGAIAAFTVAWERPNQFRKVLSNVGSFVNLRGGHVYPERVLASEKKPIRVYLCDGRNDNRGLRNGVYDEKRDWFYQNVRLMKALTREGLRRQLLLGHEPARAEIRRGNPARDDALALARRPGFHRPERHGRALFPPAGRKEEMRQALIKGAVTAGSWVLRSAPWSAGRCQTRNVVCGR